MLSAFLVSQILIGIAFLFDLASFQFKRREVTLCFFFAAASLISVHFFLLGATTAGFVMAVSAFRFVVSIFSTDKRLKYLFILLIVGLGVWTYDGWEDVFSIAAGIFGTLSSFHPDPKRLRELMAVGSVLIIVHNIMIFSPAAIALDIFFLGSNLVSYYRFYLRKSKDT